MRILTRTFARILTASLLLASASFADTVTLRDGRMVVGSFLGGDARSIRVAVGDRVETFLLSDVANLSFDSPPPSSAARPSEPTPRVFRPDNAPASPSVSPDTSSDTNYDRPRLLRRQPAATPATPPAPAAPATPATPLASSYPPPSTPVATEQTNPAYSTPPASTSTPPSAAEQVIPAGAVLTIRMVDSVDSDKDYVGEKYRASLDEPALDANGNMLVPRGADVVVKLVDDQQSGKIEGHTVLTLDLVSLNINGRDVEINTSNVSQQSSSRGARSGKVIGGATALGAIIGAVAGGGKGAAIGAASGAGAGTAAQVMTKGQRVRIPSETKLSFTLQQPVRF